MYSFLYTRQLFLLNLPVRNFTRPNRLARGGLRKTDNTKTTILHSLVARQSPHMLLDQDAYDPTAKEMLVHSDVYWSTHQLLTQNPFDAGENDWI